MRLHGDLEGIEIAFKDHTGHHQLDEYQLEYFEAVGDTPATVTCWLEMVEGSEFRIEASKLGRWHGTDLKAYVYVDGRRICKRDWPFWHPSKSVDRIAEQRGGRTVHANLQFSKLNLTDRHDIACHDPEILEGLGEIRIDIAASQGYHCNCYNKPGGSRPVRVIGPIHEEDKKGLIGSTVTGGSEQREKRRRGKDGGGPHYHIPDARSIYRVIFKYRTRDMLMALRVVGIPPTPMKAKADHKRKRADSADSDDEGEDDDVEVIEDIVTPKRPVQRRREVIVFEEDIKPLFFEELQHGGAGSIWRPIDLTSELE